MLEIQNYWEKISNKFAFDGEGKLINMQPINQKLLELAVKHTVHYSTDIIYLINSLEERFINLFVEEIDIYFRKTGIDWFDHNNHTNRPEQYRYIAKLKREGNDLILYHTLGNC